MWMKTRRGESAPQHLPRLPNGATAGSKFNWNSFALSLTSCPRNRLPATAPNGWTLASYRLATASRTRTFVSASVSRWMSSLQKMRQEANHEINGSWGCYSRTAAAWRLRRQVKSPHTECSGAQTVERASKSRSQHQLSRSEGVVENVSRFDPR